MATESPYPSSSDASTNYRLSALEKWRDAIERDQIPTMLAIMDERVQNTMKDVAVLKAQNEMLVKRDNERQGFLSGGKALVTIGLFGAIQLGGFILLIADKF